MTGVGYWTMMKQQHSMTLAFLLIASLRPKKESLIQDKHGTRDFSLKYSSLSKKREKTRLLKSVNIE